MRPTRTNQACRVVMFAAIAVLVLSLAAWVVSLWGIARDSARGGGFRLLNGWVMMANGGSGHGGLPPGWHVLGFRWPNYWPEGVRCQWTPGLKVLWVPLWLPAYTAALVLAHTWFLARAYRRHQRTGLCPSCAYDLTGITGPCPECGHNP